MSLTSSRIMEIENLTADLIDEIAPPKLPLAQALPIHLDQIVDKYGLKLKQAKFADPSLVGAYDKKTKTILISESAAYPRKIFTIAHEFGHFLLHEKKAREFFFRQDQDTLAEGQKKSEEQEANWFAASLLMPRKYLHRLYQMNDLDTLAKIFGVSRSAMTWRLTNLHLAV